MPVTTTGRSFDPLATLRDLDDEVGIYEVLLRAQSDLGDGVALLEGERFVFVNDAVSRMTGYSAGELTSPEFRLDILWAPHEKERMAERMRRRLAGEVPEDHYEVTLAPLRGPPVHCEVSVKSIFARGRRLRFAIIRDVTQRRLAEQAAEEAKRELAKSDKLAALGSLVTGVAHEVRTPLAYIQNNLAIVKHRLDRVARGDSALAESMPELLESVRMMEDGVARANHLVKDLARFTRLPTEPELARLDEVVAEALDLFRATHPGIGATVVPELERTPTLHIDRGKLQQVVLNLVGNACDALTEGGRITVRTRALPLGAALIVEDDGPGIPPDELGRIFEPFYTTKAEGMGLGLSIVRRIVELHHGSIRCESAPGEGTRFTVTLPG